MVDGYLNFNTKINTKGFERGVANIKQLLRPLASAMAVAFSVKALVNFSKQAIETASDMAEVQNVVDTAFGDMAYKMEEFSKSAIEMYGISKLAAKQTGSVFASMGAGMGLARDNATDMAIALTGLSADMASFYNVTQETASTALKSVYTGETETLKQFGIVMTQTNLEAYALSQGITKSYQAMTEAEKVQLRYGFVMKSTALAQGDFAKTSDGWANQTRILTEQWKEFSGIIGNALVGILLPGLRALNNLLGELISWASTAAQALADVFGFEISAGSTVSKTTDNITEQAQSYEDMAKSAEDAQAATDGMLAGFDKVEKISGDDTSGTSGSTLPITATQPVTAEIEPKIKNNKLKEAFKGIKKLFNPLITSLQNLWKKAEPFIDNIGDGLKWLWDEILKPFGEWTIGEAAPAFIDAIGEAIEGLNAAWETAEPVVMSFWNNFLEPIAQWAADAVIDVITAIGSQLKEWGENLTEDDVKTFAAIAATCFELFLSAKLLSGIQTMTAKLSGLKGVAQSLGSTLGSDVSMSFSTLGAVISAAIVGWNIGKWLYDHFSEEINSVMYLIYDCFFGIINGMLSGVESFVNFFIKGINKIIEAINSISFEMPDWLGGERVGFNLKTINEITLPRLPMLASGTVVPANFGEFRAILGDNKREPEVVSPLSTIKQAVAEVVGSGGETVIYLILDGKEIYKTVVKENKANTIKTGVNALAE